MKTKFIAFHGQADRLITDPTKRSEILAAAIARAIANVQPLPSSAVDSAVNYFNTQVLPNVRNAVSDWNESMVFNTKSALDFARSFWMIRYNAAHPNARPLYDSPYDFFCTTMGVNGYISEVQYNFLNEQKETILALSTSASFLLDAEGSANG